MIKYRPHKGSLDEAMKGYKEFSNISDILIHIEDELEGFVKSKDIVIGESYGEDERIGWKSWRHVCTTQMDNIRYDTPQCIGMCDLGELDETEKERMNETDN